MVHISGILPEMDWLTVQIWAKVQFLQNEHVLKFQKCLFFRNKSPCGSILTKGSFSELTPDELIHFCYDLKNWLFTIFVFLVTFYGIRSLFYRKPKWSVWSIWTYYTGWIFKFVIEKLSFGGKLKTWVFENMKILVLGSKMDFWGSFQDQNDF